MRNGRIDLWVVAQDGFCALLALWINLYVSGMLERTGIEWPAASWLLAFLLSWILICDRMQLDRFYMYRSELMSRVTVACFTCGLVSWGLSVMVGKPMRGFHVSVFTTAFFLMISLTRLLHRGYFLHRHLAPERRQRAVIVGSGTVARELADALEKDPSKRYTVVGILAPEAEEVAGRFPGVSAEDTMATVGITDYLIANKIDDVYVTLPNSGDPDVVRLVGQCRRAGMSVAFVPHDYELFITRSVLRSIGSIPLVAVDGRKVSPTTLYFRTVWDIAIAGVVLLMVAPLFLSIAAVLTIMRSRPIKGQIRCGAGVKQFTLYSFNIRTDPQASRFDRLLKFTMLSHLPELWNVMRGEMCLVGPRPEPPERVHRFMEWEKQRFNVIPGITGHAQIYGVQGKRSAAEKARRETHYASGWFPLLDFVVIVQTLWSIFRRLVIAAFAAAAWGFRPKSASFGMEVANVDSSHPAAD